MSDDSFIGRAGTATKMPMPESDDWRMEASLDAWLADCPGQSPAWRFYVLTAVALRDVEGQDEQPKLRNPRCSHEILVLALDPSSGSTPHPDMLMSGATFSPLRPVNIAMQIEDCTDDQCRELLTLLARGVAEGVLPAEPPFNNPHHDPTWARTINAALEHIKLGGHPDARA